MTKSNPSNSRRRFIGKAGSAILAATAAPTILRGAHHENPRKLGMLIVGLGGYAKASIAPEIASCDHVTFAGVMTGDREKGRRYAAEYGFPEDAIYGYDEWDKVAADDRIDYVHVTLPNNLHAEHSIAAAGAGKHVIVEKPMATTIDDCRAMIAAAKENDVLLGVNYRLQFEPHHQKAIELISNGTLGSLTNGNYEFSWSYSRALLDPKRRNAIKQWLLDPVATGGGALFDTGVYPIQAACYLSGSQPVSVRGMAQTYHTDIYPEDVEETMAMELLFEDGFQALCRASYAHSFHQCTSVGPKGSVEILPGQGGSVYGQSGNGKARPRVVVANRKEHKFEDPLQQAVLHDEFAKAILAESKTFATPGEMGLRDIQIMKAIQASAQKGGTLVEVDYEA
ncbi:MAG: Gfo/Idh/MocA family oxidoreductase [Verrucomicrobiota bacterium]